MLGIGKERIEGYALPGWLGIFVEPFVLESFFGGEAAVGVVSE